MIIFLNLSFRLSILEFFYFLLSVSALVPNIYYWCSLNKMLIKVCFTSLFWYHFKSLRHILMITRIIMWVINVIIILARVIIFISSHASCSLLHSSQKAVASAEDLWQHVAVTWDKSSSTVKITRLLCTCWFSDNSTHKINDTWKAKVRELWTYIDEFSGGKEQFLLFLRSIADKADVHGQIWKR